MDAFPATIIVEGKRTDWKPKVVKYADDFGVLHPDRDAIVKCRAIASQWLSAIGLTLKPEKTHISHTLSRNEHSSGFNFLGFNFRQHPDRPNQVGMG